MIFPAKYALSGYFYVAKGYTISYHTKNKIKGVFMSDKYKNAYFAASNSAHGFISYFGKIFDPVKLQKIYILKGGPGTGKSRLMHEIGKQAELEGYDVEYFLCSSDTNSLDGIIISELNTAIIDGTSPHLTDPVFPGATEEIINLGDFFNVKILTSEKENIMRLVNAKSELYKRAYAFMACGGSLKREYDNTVCAYILCDKMEAYTERLVCDIPKGEKSEEHIRITKAYGTSGAVHLDTFSKNTTVKYIIKDKYGSSYALFSLLYEKLKEKQQKIYVSYDPLLEYQIDGIYLPDLGISFTKGAESEDCKMINMARFVDCDGIKSQKKRLNFIKKAYVSVVSEALSYLSSVRILHEELEGIYISSMDFTRKEKLTAKLAKAILSDK